jgi:hypothetical protein
LLHLIHPIADVVTDLYRLVVIYLKLFSGSVLEDSLACLASTLYLLAPFFMVLNIREQDELFTAMAGYANDLKELFEDVGAMAGAQDAWTLKRTILFPTRDAFLAE